MIKRKHDQRWWQNAIYRDKSRLMCRTNPKNWLTIGLFALLIQCAMGLLAGSVVGCRRQWQEISADGNDFIAISTGWSHSLVLKSDGSIVGWGENRWGMADSPDSCHRWSRYNDPC